MNVTLRLPLRSVYSCPKFYLITMFKHTKKSTTNTVQHRDVTISAVKDFDVLKTPIKSASDKKEYKVIRLKNGLTACLVSDTSIILKPSDLQDVSDSSESEYDTESETESSDQTASSDTAIGNHDDSKMKKVSEAEQKMAAVALSIGVGSFSDPPDIPGLAHFLEHMVFMGSEKYPQENDFDSFIKKKGGSDNASTDCEMTTFYFECLEKHLYKSLDKFAQFFISPLMNKESMSREREAIESEFQMAVPSDTYRKEQMLMSLFHPSVPINSFAWGNLKTLRDSMDDDALYKRLHEFRKYHYSAHRMTLAIQARLSMSTLEGIIVDYFGNVPSNNYPADDFKKYADIIFDNPEFTKIMYIEPIKELIQIDITWPLPSLIDMYKSKPHEYLSWLIGHEGKGSLLSYLKKKVWGLAISSGNDESGSDHNSIYTLFTINIILTNEGLEHLDEVLAAVYSYLNLLRKVGPQERIFKEIQLVQETSFKFTEEEEPVDFVEDLVECMQVYPPEYYLAGGELYFEYDPKAIQMVLSHFRVDKMNIMILTSTIPNGLHFDKVEPWFNINYTTQEVPQSWKDKWNSVPVYPEFALPPPNPFLTTDFSVLPTSPDMPKHPQKVFSIDTLELWYKQDNKFKFPVAYYNFYFISPLVNESAVNSCLMDMFINLLLMQVTDDLFPASAGFLTYNVLPGDKGIYVKVDGYNEKLPILLGAIMENLVKVSDCLTVQMFEAVKDKLAKAYYNRFIKPSDLAKELRLSILLSSHWSPVDKYAVMFKLTYDMIRQFGRDFVKSIYIIGLVQGNVSKEAAISTTKSLLEVLKCEPLPPQKYPKIRVHELPKGDYCCRAMSFNQHDANSFIVNYYQSDIFTIKTNVILEVLMMHMEEPVFDILRTKEQLGYNVYCTMRDTLGILGYSITVNAHAARNTTDYVDSRIEAFVRHVNKMLRKMPEKKLALTKRDLIKIKRCGDVDLAEEVNRNWAEIVTRDFMFDRAEKEIKAVEELRVADIRKFWEDHNIFSGKNTSKKLSVQVVGYNVVTDEKAQRGSRKPTDKTRLSPKMVKKMKGNGKGHNDSEQDDVNKPYPLKLVGRLSPSEERDEKHFIRDIREFKKKLPLYPEVRLN